jgi:sugar transferase (PEP-CTERM/EpsH1 system associated)
MRFVYRSEAANLERYERRIAEEFDRLLLVSESEKLLFPGEVPGSKLGALRNGVDLDYFSPKFRPTLPVTGPMLVFTGAMDYWPNIDGAAWFIQNVFDRVLAVCPDVSFHVVGSNPVRDLRRLAAGRPEVVVTGYVDDVRNYLAAADLCVVPLRIARGIQNKVLEAMAMGKAVVCTPEALEGIDAPPGAGCLRAEAPEAFASAVIDLLCDGPRSRRLGMRGRAFVESRFSWPGNLAPLDSILGAGAEAPPPGLTMEAM